MRESRPGFSVAGIVIVTVLGLAMGACAAIRNRESSDTERVLAAAGFQISLADTPQKLAHLQTLTQRKIVPHQQDGQVRYVYADASACKCLYMGSQEAYQRYQKLAIKRELAQDQVDAAEMNEDAEMNWGMWGWGPYY